MKNSVSHSVMQMDIDVRTVVSVQCVSLNFWYCHIWLMVLHILQTYPVPCSLCVHGKGETWICGQ